MKINHTISGDDWCTIRSDNDDIWFSRLSITQKYVLLTATEYGQVWAANTLTREVKFYALLWALVSAGIKI